MHLSKVDFNDESKIDYYLIRFSKLEGDFDICLLILAIRILKFPVIGDGAVQVLIELALNNFNFEFRKASFC